jgi:hypothetical protein
MAYIEVARVAAYRSRFPTSGRIRNGAVNACGPLQAKRRACAQRADWVFGGLRPALGRLPLGPDLPRASLTYLLFRRLILAFMVAHSPRRCGAGVDAGTDGGVATAGFGRSFFRLPRDSGMLPRSPKAVRTCSRLSVHRLHAVRPTCQTLRRFGEGKAWRDSSAPGGG